MNYQSAKIFLSIVEHQSISAAAKTLFMTQSTASSYLSRLEEELEVKLFLRQKGKQKLTLTPEGEGFISIAKEMLAVEQHLQEYKTSFKHKVLRIGASYAVHEFLVRAITEKMSQAFPDVELQLYIIPLGTGRVRNTPQPYDVSIRIYPNRRTASDNQLFAEHRFFFEPQRILCPINTPLPDRILTADDLDCTFEIRKTNITEATAVWLHKYFPEARPSRYPTIMNQLNVHQYFDDPRCWAFVPSTIAEYLATAHPEQLVCRDFCSQPQRRTGMITVSKTYRHQDVLRVFFQCCQEYLDEHPFLEGLLEEDTAFS